MAEQGEMLCLDSSRKVWLLRFPSHIIIPLSAPRTQKSLDSFESHSGPYYWRCLAYFSALFASFSAKTCIVLTWSIGNSNSGCLWDAPYRLTKGKLHCQYDRTVDRGSKHEYTLCFEWWSRLLLVEVMWQLVTCTWEIQSNPIWACTTTSALRYAS